MECQTCSETKFVLAETSCGCEMCSESGQCSMSEMHSLISSTRQFQARELDDCPICLSAPVDIALQ